MSNVSSAIRFHRSPLSTGRGLLALLLVVGVVAALASCSSGDIGNSIPILDHIVVFPGDTTIFAGATIHFMAIGKDAGGNDVPLDPSWIMSAGPGTLTSEGVFTAGNTAGTFPNLVRATSGSVSGAATVTIEIPPP
jgi:hypothetical protein